MKERKKEKFEKAYAMPSADLSICHQKRRICFTTHFLLPSFSMEILRVKESLSYEFYPPNRPDTSPFKAKTAVQNT